jgi:hypothetical protein
VQVFEPNIPININLQMAHHPTGRAGGSARISLLRHAEFQDRDITVVARPHAYDVPRGLATMECVVSKVQFTLRLPPGSELNQLNDVTMHYDPSIMGGAGGALGFSVISMGGLNDDFDIEAYSSLVTLIAKPFSSLFY